MKDALVDWKLALTESKLDTSQMTQEVFDFAVYVGSGSPHGSMSLAELIRSYAVGIAAVMREQPRARSLWSGQEQALDDFFATLRHRDEVKVLLTESYGPRWGPLTSLVSGIDGILRDGTVAVENDIRSGNREKGESDWWWRRLPVTGPVAEGYLLQRAHR